jgi:hypothetical protein
MRLGHLIAILGESAGRDESAFTAAYTIRRRISAGLDDLFQHLILQPVHAEDADAVAIEEK